MTYVIITPAKNEEKYIRETLESVAKQTITPYRWILVDDGSNDNTANLINDFARKHPWVKLLSINNKKEQRSGGSKVVNAFNKGYSLLYDTDYDYIVKLDADLILPSNYFETILDEFKNNEKLGCCGGTILNKYSNKKLIREPSSKYHVRGALKCYRRECFNQIGGFRSIWNWDGLDELTARYYGWETYSIDINVIHLRPTTSEYNLYKHNYKSGYESFRLGNDLVLTLVRTVKKSLKKPYLVGGVLFLLGYFEALFLRPQRHIDKDLAKFIRRFHYKRLFRI